MSRYPYVLPDDSRDPYSVPRTPMPDPYGGEELTNEVPPPGPTTWGACRECGGPNGMPAGEISSGALCRTCRNHPTKETP